MLKLVAIAADAVPVSIYWGTSAHGLRSCNIGVSRGQEPDAKRSVRDDALGLRIGHNVEAAAVQRHLRASSDRLAVSMQRLSSGLRINSAADDAAGLGISERMRGQIRGLEVANRNVQDGISMLNTMEGALSTVHTILQRARTLAVQYNNLAGQDDARQTIIDEFAQLSNEIARIESSTNFNGITLLQNATATVTLQVGANDGETMSISLVDLFGPGLNLVRSVSFSLLTFTDADINAFDQHIGDVATARARIGAQTNRLEHTMNVNAIAQEQLMASESRIRDVDMASEMTVLTRNQIIQQSGMAMLAKANQNHGRILDLLN